MPALDGYGWVNGWVNGWKPGKTLRENTTMKTTMDHGFCWWQQKCELISSPKSQQISKFTASFFEMLQVTFDFLSPFRPTQPKKKSVASWQLQPAGSPWKQGLVQHRAETTQWPWSALRQKVAHQEGEACRDGPMKTKLRWNPRNVSKIYVLHICILYIYIMYLFNPY